jgi:hypothetical protein
MNTSITLEDARAMRFAESSRRVVGATWKNENEGTTISHNFSPVPEGWMPYDAYISSINAYDTEDPDAGWEQVPSMRILRKREKAAERRRAREAGMTVSEIRAFQSAMADSVWDGWVGRNYNA